jgi:hypothetical protein
MILVKSLHTSPRSLQNDMVVQDVGLGVPKAAEEAAHLFAIDLS